MELNTTLWIIGIILLLVVLGIGFGFWKKSGNYKTKRNIFSNLFWYIIFLILRPFGLIRDLAVYVGRNIGKLAKRLWRSINWRHTKEYFINFFTLGRIIKLKYLLTLSVFVLIPLVLFSLLQYNKERMAGSMEIIVVFLFYYMIFGLAISIGLIPELKSYGAKYKKYSERIELIIRNGNATLEIIFKAFYNKLPKIKFSYFRTGTFILAYLLLSGLIFFISSDMKFDSNGFITIFVILLGIKIGLMIKIFRSLTFGDSSKTMVYILGIPFVLSELFIFVLDAILRKKELFTSLYQTIPNVPLNLIIQIISVLLGLAMFLYFFFKDRQRFSNTNTLKHGVFEYFMIILMGVMYTVMVLLAASQINSNGNIVLKEYQLVQVVSESLIYYVLIMAYFYLCVHATRLERLWESSTLKKPLLMLEGVYLGRATFKEKELLFGKFPIHKNYEFLIIGKDVTDKDKKFVTLINDDSLLMSQKQPIIYGDEFKILCYETVNILISEVNDKEIICYTPMYAKVIKKSELRNLT